MAISFISAAGAGTTSATLTTPNAGDIIIVFAYRNTTTAPTLATGYANITNGSANSNAYRVGFKFSDGTETTTGTWANANVVKAVVYRGVGSVGGWIDGTNAASTSTQIQAFIPYAIDGNSWVVAFAASRQTTSQSTPAGTTLRGSATTGTTSIATSVDTNGGTANWTSKTSTAGASATGTGVALELAPIGNDISTFVDPMTSNTQNTTLWGQNFGNLSWSSTGTTLSTTANSAGYSGETTNGVYSLINSAIYVQVANLGSQTQASAESIPLQLDWGSSNYKIFFYANGGTLFAYKTVAGTQTSVTSGTYNSSTMKWFRIAEGTGRLGGTSGTTYLDYSADGNTWTSFTSLANPFRMTGLHVSPSLGTYANETSATTLKITNINVPNSVTLTNTITGTANIISTLTLTQPGTARIANTQSTVQTAISRISIAYAINQLATSRISNGRTKTQGATARLTKLLTRTQPAAARIAKSQTKTNTATARISKSYFITQSAIASIVFSFTGTKTQTAVARIAKSFTNVQPATARVTKAITKTQGATARVSKTQTKTQPATARITKTFALTQGASARISKLFANNQTSRAFIAGLTTNTKSQLGTARLIKTTTSSRVAAAFIVVPFIATKTQAGTARIVKSFTSTRTAVARIAKMYTKTQPASARVLRTSVTSTQTAVARINAPIYGTFTQNATARIIAVRLKTQIATAKISQTYLAGIGIQLDTSQDHTIYLGDNSHALPLAPRDNVGIL